MPRSPLSIVTLALASLVYVAFAVPAQATVITFDDFPPAPWWDPQTISEEYAPLGVHFVGTDDGHFMEGSGWGIAGSNGPNFLGFDGQSYAVTATFDAPVSGVRLDVTRPVSNASSNDDFVMRGYLGGVMVDEVMVDVGEAGQWQTVMLNGTVDVIEMFGLSGHLPLHYFAVDNLVWNGDGGGNPEPPAMMDMTIDVKPGNDANRVDPSSGGVVSVMLYGSEDLQMMDVDPGSLLFGPVGVGCAHDSGPHLTDYDGDGLMDAKAHFRMSGSGVEHGDVEVCVSGTANGMEFVGCDMISTHMKTDETQARKRK